LKSWRAIGYIFLGFGTVFLTLALFIFFGLVHIFSGTPFISQASFPISLSASAPWLVISALMYVVGIVGYFAGKETTYTQTLEKQKRKPISSKIDRYWSFPAGAISTLAVLLLQYFSRGRVYTDVEAVLPISISIAAGLIVGIATYLILSYLD
jgi:predicted membrane channel-forming protein YqfA (hemolysin III family)